MIALPVRPRLAFRPRLLSLLVGVFLTGLRPSALASELAWASATTAAPVRTIWTPAVGREGPAPAVIYLRGLSVPRAGTVPDEVLVAEFRDAGFGVFEVDYAGHPRATLPGLVDDLVQLRLDLRDGRLLAGERLDPARIFIVPSGCRLRRDVTFSREGDRVLGLDVVYPAEPRTPVGTVLEFSCDNANRMGNGSLAFCTDALLPLAALAGHAAAMADHPVAAPYRGIDPMPESAFRAKAAVRALRALGESGDLPLNGRIVPAGFSRGSGIALLLATTEGNTTWEGGGTAPERSSAVHGAVVMSGRFTYLDLLPDDPMIPRHEAIWGPRGDAEARWRAQGALDALARPIPYPLFLTINPTESPHALHQMQVLQRRLDALGSPYVYAPEATDRGHRMPVEPDVISAILGYLKARLSPDPDVP